MRARRGIRGWLMTLALLCAFSLRASHPAPAGGQSRAAATANLLMGFSSSGGQQQVESERRFAQSISTEKISQFHAALTARPHIAGTPAGQAVAEEIAARLGHSGLEVETHRYQAYLSHPARIRVTQTMPLRRNLSVYERSDPRDPSTGHAELTPGFIAYSASGRVSGPVVYVNYGLPADYEALEAAGVKVRGAIVLARYGKVHRAVKVFNAEQRGARGILIFSDPADDGYAKGAVWPRGPWREAWFAQRGNAKYSWFWHGDPLTPFAAATREAARHKPEDAPTLPKIPAVALSWSAARNLLGALGGQSVPAGFQGGLPFTYYAGPGPAEVELDVQMNDGLKPISNVVGRIVGSAEADRWVILGTHHDAWTFGGVDPGSSAAVLLEVARALGELRKSGWQPRRSILIAFWDAEEYGLIGSTEFAEQFAAELREKAVAYVNSDLYMAGDLEAGGTASLRDFVAEVARAVAHPASRENLYAAWRRNTWGKLASREKRRLKDSFEVELEPLGSGADFVPFQTHLGLPALSLEFGTEGSYGSYHSSYDTRFYMETFGDPGWRYGRALAELLGRTAMRLAAAEALPFGFVHAAEKLGQHLEQLEQQNVNGDGRPYLAELGLDGVRAGVKEFGRQAEALRAALAEKLPSGALDAKLAREVNDCLLRAEKGFVAEDSPGGGAGRWYRHLIYGWNIYALYSGQTLPVMHRALTERDARAFAAERDRLERSLARAAEELAKAAALLR